MAVLTIQTFDEAGADLTMSAAAAGGDQFTNTGKEIIIIVNNDAASKTVTITAQNTSFEDKTFGNAVKQDQQLSVSASGGIGIMGPFPRRAFNDPGNNVQITYSSVTSLEIAVVKES